MMAMREGAASMHFVVATHSRELKTAVFLALNTVPTITIVATANSTAELISYCRTFLPDVAIVESGLPGRPLADVLHQLGDAATPGRIFVIGEDGASELARDVGAAEVLRDVDHLLATLPELTLDEEH